MRPSRLRYTLLVLLGLGMIAAACGVAVDNDARPIATGALAEELRPGQLPTPTVTPTLVPGEEAPAPGIGPVEEQIYMLRGQRLVLVPRAVTDNPERLLEILLAGTALTEREAGIQTAMSRNAQVQSVMVNDISKLAIVDLAPGSLDPRNSERRLAFGQMVFSLTSLDAIDQVQFVQTDPENPDQGPVGLQVQTDSGTTPAGARVSRADFDELSPTTPNPAFDLPLATPTPTEALDAGSTQLFELGVWMIDENQRLVRVPRTLERSLDALLENLFQGPTPDEQRDAGLISALPPDALSAEVIVEQIEILVRDLAGVNRPQTINLALLDLQPGSLPAIAASVDEQGQTVGLTEPQYLAVAQLVYTLTELSEIKQVAFSIAGFPQPVPVDIGLSTPYSTAALEDPTLTVGLDRDDFQRAFSGVTVVPPSTPTSVPPPATAAPSDASQPQPEPTATPEPTPTPTPIPASALPPTPVPTTTEDP